MKNLLAILIAVLLSFDSFSQRRQVTQLPFNKEARENLTNSLQYLEPDFVMGGISLNDGTLIRTLMNFNILFDEVHFVIKDAESGEEQIRILNNMNDLNFVSIGKRTFLHFPKLGFFEIIVNGEVKLAKRTTLELLADDKPTDGYGNLPESAATTKIGYFDMHQHDFDMLSPSDQDRLIAAKTIKTEKYYVIRDGKTPRVINSKRGMLKLLPKSKRNEIDDFIGKLSGSWNSESNLIETFKFLNK